MTATTPVTCPTCFEVFEVPSPPPSETPCEVDYDCEVCCHPMVIAFDSEPDSDLDPDADSVHGEARSLGD